MSACQLTCLEQWTRQLHVSQWRIHDLEVGLIWTQGSVGTKCQWRLGAESKWGVVQASKSQIHRFTVLQTQSADGRIFQAAQNR